MRKVPFRKLWAKMYLYWNGICIKHFQEKIAYTADGSVLHNCCPMCEYERDQAVSMALNKAAEILRGQQPHFDCSKNQVQSQKGWN